MGVFEIPATRRAGACSAKIVGLACFAATYRKVGCEQSRTGSDSTPLAAVEVGVDSTKPRLRWTDSAPASTRLGLALASVGPTKTKLVNFGLNSAELGPRATKLGLEHESVSASSDEVAYFSATRARHEPVAAMSTPIHLRDGARPTEQRRELT